MHYERFLADRQRLSTVFYLGNADGLRLCHVIYVYFLLWSDVLPRPEDTLVDQMLEWDFFPECFLDRGCIDFRCEVCVRQEPFSLKHILCVCCIFNLLIIPSLQERVFRVRLW